MRTQIHRTSGRKKRNSGAFYWISVSVPCPLVFAAQQLRLRKRDNGRANTISRTKRRERARENLYVCVYIPVTVVGEGAVAGEGDKGAAADAQGVEDLRRCVRPDAGVHERGPARRNVPHDAIYRAFQRRSCDRKKDWPLFLYTRCAYMSNSLELLIFTVL